MIVWIRDKRAWDWRTELTSGGSKPIIGLVVGPSFREDVREYISLSRVPDLILDVENQPRDSRQHYLVNGIAWGVVHRH